MMGEADAAMQMEIQEARHLDLVEQRMVATFSPPLSSGDVRRAMEQARAEFESARVRLSVPLLVERAARQDLNALVRAAGDRTRSKLSLGDVTFGPPVLAVTRGAHSGRTGVTE
jgi:hypothetical protein